MKICATTQLCTCILKTVHTHLPDRLKNEPCHFYLPSLVKRAEQIKAVKDHICHLDSRCQSILWQNKQTVLTILYPQVFPAVLLFFLGLNGLIKSLQMKVFLFIYFSPNRWQSQNSKEGWWNRCLPRWVYYEKFKLLKTSIGENTAPPPHTTVNVILAAPIRQKNAVWG